VCRWQVGCPIRTTRARTSSHREDQRVPAPEGLDQRLRGRRSRQAPASVREAGLWYECWPPLARIGAHPRTRLPQESAGVLAQWGYRVQPPAGSAGSQ